MRARDRSHVASIHETHCKEALQLKYGLFTLRSTARIYELKSVIESISYIKAITDSNEMKSVFHAFDVV